MSRPVARAVHSSGFALLTETMLVGVVVAVVSLPLATALPALAAGARHLRRHHEGTDGGVRGLLDEVRRAVAGLWVPGLGLPLVLGFLAFEAWFLTANPIPGGRLVALLSGVLGATVVVVGLRLAGTWADEVPWPTQLRAAVARTGQDLVGSSLLVAAVGIAGVLVWMLPPLAVVVGGLLAFASLSVESRWASTTEPV